MQKRAKGMFAKKSLSHSNLPYKGFSEIELLTVEKALRSAWREVIRRKDVHEIDCWTDEEEAISSAIVLIFDTLISEQSSSLDELSKTFDPLPEFNGQRGSVNYLGKPLKKRPDLSFRRLYTEPGTSKLNDCLFIEAKIIDRSRNMGRYCGDGLQRFVDGDYAWAMPQAMMIGYVRETKQRLPDALTKHFERRGKITQYRLEQGPIAFRLSRAAERMYKTVHGRHWKYPSTKDNPGNIEVFHLWLVVR